MSECGGIKMVYYSRGFKKIVHQFKWFIISGGLATLLNYVVFFMLYKYGNLNSVYAAGVGYISGMFLSFS